jgi:hypothetical protein
VIEEFLFSAGYYSRALVTSYLGTVVALIESLTLGSIQLAKSSRIKTTYYLFSLTSTAALAYFLSTVAIGNILVSYVVYGTIPLSIVVVSSAITFPVAVVLVATAALTYRKTKNSKMLSIVAGVVIVTIAGSLYIVQFPAFLYCSEFIGILLLWSGFFDFTSLREQKEVAASLSTDQEAHSPPQFVREK